MSLVERIVAQATLDPANRSVGLNVWAMARLGTMAHSKAMRPIFLNGAPLHGARKGCLGEFAS
jgi:hypothetical protein